MFTRPSRETIESLAKGRKIVYSCFWGSQVYGTASATSDWDVMCVIDSEDEPCVLTGVSAKDAVQLKSRARTRGVVEVCAHGEITFVTVTAWKRAIFECRPEFLECLFAPRDFVLIPFDWEEKLCMDNLSFSVEWEAGRTLARARRKIKEGIDMKKARKELFHSLRYLIFGKQIADRGRLVDFSAANALWAEIRDCNAGDLDIDKTWLPKYKEFFRAFCASAGDPPSSCLGLLRDASHRCQNRQLKISEASAEKSESLSWLRELGCLQTLIECGFSVFEAPPDLVVISASSFRTAFVFEYAKRLFDFATQLMVVVCVTDGEELRVVAQSSAPEVSFVHRGLEQTASAFGFCPIPRLLSNRHQLENESERGMAACSILSFEGGEVVDGVAQAEPNWLDSSFVFIYLRAAPVLHNAHHLLGLVKTAWPDSFVGKQWNILPVIDRVEGLAEEVKTDRSLLGKHQELSRLVVARLESRDRMMLAFTRLKSGSALAIFHSL